MSAKKSKTDFMDIHFLQISGLSGSLKYSIYPISMRLDDYYLSK